MYIKHVLNNKATITREHSFMKHTENWHACVGVITLACIWLSEFSFDIDELETKVQTGKFFDGDLVKMCVYVCVCLY